MDSHSLVDLHAELRYLLNEWDPLGVADVVRDEYNCLLACFLRRLNEGASQLEMSEFVWHEVEKHSGIDPMRCGADRFGALLVGWFRVKTDQLG